MATIFIWSGMDTTIWPNMDRLFGLLFAEANTKPVFGTALQRFTKYHSNILQII